jgi:hypothetical protein
VSPALVSTVSPARPGPPDADFAAVRDRAMATVQAEQAAAPAPWTDHNLHDPGITLLEAALFAIADLHYRIAERRFDAWPFELGEWRGLLPAHSLEDRNEVAAWFGDAIRVKAARAQIVARAGARGAALLDLAATLYPGVSASQRLRPAAAAAVLRQLREPVLQRALLERSGVIDWTITTAGTAARATAVHLLEDLGLWGEEVDALLGAARRRRVTRFIRRHGDELRAIVESASDMAQALTRLAGPHDEGGGALLTLDQDQVKLALGLHPCPPAAPEVWEKTAGETTHWPPHPLQARTSEPVTRDDYRRLALAAKDIKRAWVVPGLGKGIKWTGGVTNATPRPSRLGGVTIVVDDGTRPLLRYDADVTPLQSALGSVLNDVLGLTGAVSDGFPDYRDSLTERGPRRLLGDEVVVAPLLRYPVVVRGTLEILPTATGSLVLDEAESLLRAYISPDRTSPLDAPPPTPEPLRCPQDLDGPWPPAAAARTFIADPHGSQAERGWHPADPVRATELVQLLHEVPGVVGVDKLQLQLDGEGAESWHEELRAPIGFEQFSVPSFDHHCLCVRIFDPQDCRNA